MTSRNTRLSNIKYKMPSKKIIYYIKTLWIFSKIWSYLITTFILFAFKISFEPYYKNADYLYLMCIKKFSETLENVDKTYEGKFLSWRRLIYDRAYIEPYLVRYYIFFTDRNKFPFNIFIHKFMKGDDDEDPHDHPWGFFHIILSGGYWEEVPIDKESDFKKGFHKVWRNPGYWNIVDSSYTHRIDIDINKPKPWTIFIPFKHNNKWGFWVKNKTNEWQKIDHISYLENKKT